MYLKCEWCGGIFYVKKLSNRGEYHYCSQECITARDRNNYKIRFLQTNKTYRLVTYENKKSVTIECRTCGTKYIKGSANAIRSVTCKNCTSQRIKEREERVERLKELKKQYKEYSKKLEHIKTQLERNYQRKATEEERKEKAREHKRAADKRKELIRERRIKNNGKIDKDIDLSKLYIRDKGVCHLCGGLCNYEDYSINEKGDFITGLNYPSIDHITPLSKGGTHTWDNIKLAHMICNSRKSNIPGRV